MQVKHGTKTFITKPIMENLNPEFNVEVSHVRKNHFLNRFLSIHIFLIFFSSFVAVRL